MINNWKHQFFQKLTFEHQYESLVPIFKTKMREFNCNRICNEEWPIPKRQIPLLYILNQDGTLNKNLPNEVWDRQDRIRVTIWASGRSYKRTWSKTKGVIETRPFSYDDRPFVTVSGQIRNHFLEIGKNKIAKEKAVEKTYKLLGMGKHAKGDQTDRFFVEIWVDPNSLFRPTRNPTIKQFCSTSDTIQTMTQNPDPNYYSGKVWHLSKSEEKAYWSESSQNSLLSYIHNYQNDYCYKLYGRRGDNLRRQEYSYPFTGLGYTFNWDHFGEYDLNYWMQSKDRIGMTQFVLKSGSHYELAGIYDTYDYLTSNCPKDIQKQLAQKLVTSL